jgi:hypothetical protein
MFRILSRIVFVLYISFLQHLSLTMPRCLTPCLLALLPGCAFAQESQDAAPSAPAAAPAAPPESLDAGVIAEESADKPAEETWQQWVPPILLNNLKSGAPVDFLLPSLTSQTADLIRKPGVDYNLLNQPEYDPVRRIFDVVENNANSDFRSSSRNVASTFRHPNSDGKQHVDDQIRVGRADSADNNDGNIERVASPGNNANVTIAVSVGRRSDSSESSSDTGCVRPTSHSSSGTFVQVHFRGLQSPLLDARIRSARATLLYGQSLQPISADNTAAAAKREAAERASAKHEAYDKCNAVDGSVPGIHDVQTRNEVCVVRLIRSDFGIKDYNGAAGSQHI